MFLRFVFFCLLVVSVLTLPRLYQKTTHGFRLAKCRFEWPFVPEWETTSICQNEILSQPFTYFAKGKQSYVFCSQDGQYVLKLFRFSKRKILYGQMFRKPLMEELPSEERVIQTLSGCREIFERGPHVSQLVFVHLNPKKGEIPPILLKDRLGRNVRLDPGKDRFIVQRKGEVFFKRLKGEKDKEPLIAAFLRLLDELARLGFVNTDLTMGRNFGYLGGEVFLLDVGNLTCDPRLAEANRTHFIQKMHAWIEKHL